MEDVVIVGGGVIGLACGLALQRDGRTVRVVEQGRLGCGSSHGNCGTITPSHAMPLAAPGTITRALRWMATPDAPLYIKPRIDPTLWAWLLRFGARCHRRDWLQAAAAKAAILQASRRALPEWIARHGMACEFVESGTDHVFRTAASLGAFAPDLTALAELGISSLHIDGPAYQREEPALRDGVVGVVRFPGDASLRPDRFVAELARVFRAAGGLVSERSPVEGITTEGGIEHIHCGTTVHRARTVVIATGAWSPRIGSRLLGSSVLHRLMQPGKGYSITYERPSVMPRRPLVLHERSVCVTAWPSGFRLGSTMEFSGYDTTLNRRRLDALERAARDYLVEPVGPSVTEEWFGWRPMTTDDVPIIGPVPGESNRWVATGHGMLGVSMSVATAELIAALVIGRPPDIDPAPYRVERFA